MIPIRQHLRAVYPRSVSIAAHLIHLSEVVTAVIERKYLASCFQGSQHDLYRLAADAARELLTDGHVCHTMYLCSIVMNAIVKG